MALIKLTTPQCSVCEKSSVLELDSEDIARWKEGALIQDVWPDLPAEIREVLISGTHPQCWEELFTVVENEIDFFNAVYEIDEGHSL